MYDRFFESLSAYMIKILVLYKGFCRFFKMFHVKQVAFRQLLSNDGCILILDNNLSMERLDCI